MTRYSCDTIETLIETRQQTLALPSYVVLLVCPEKLVQPHLATAAERAVFDLAVLVRDHQVAVRVAEVLVRPLAIRRHVFAAAAHHHRPVLAYPALVELHWRRHIVNFVGRRLCEEWAVGM